MASVHPSYHQDTQFSTVNSGVTYGDGIAPALYGRSLGTLSRTSSAGAVTPTAAELTQGNFVYICTKAATDQVITFPSAASMWTAVIARGGVPYVGMTIPFVVQQGHASNQTTLAADAGATVTIVGVAAVAAGLSISQRWIVLTGPATASVL